MFTYEYQPSIKITIVVSLETKVWVQTVSEGSTGTRLGNFKGAEPKEYTFYSVCHWGSVWGSRTTVLGPEDGTRPSTSRSCPPRKTKVKRWL